MLLQILRCLIHLIHCILRCICHSFCRICHPLCTHPRTTFKDVPCVVANFNNMLFILLSPALLSSLHFHIQFSYFFRARNALNVPRSFPVVLCENKISGLQCVHTLVTAICSGRIPDSRKTDSFAFHKFN